MAKRALLFAVLLAVALLAGAAASQPLPPQQLSAQSYVADFSIDSSGVARLDSASYELESIAGEHIIGSLSSAGHELCLGWYCIAETIAPSAPTAFALVGMLNYSNGTLVADKQITVSISNASLGTFSVGAITDSSGHFAVSMVNLPGALINSDIRLTITVYGDVQAVYDRLCAYDAAGNKFICS